MIHNVTTQRMALEGYYTPLGFFRRRVTADTLEVALRERRSETLAECSSIGAVGSGALDPRRLSSAAAAAAIPRDTLWRFPRPNSSSSIDGCDGTATGDVPKRVAVSESPEAFPEMIGPEIGAEMGLEGIGWGGCGGMRVKLSAKRGRDVAAEFGREDAAGAPAEVPSTLDSGDGWNSGDTCIQVTGLGDVDTGNHKRCEHTLALIHVTTLKSACASEEQGRCWQHL